MRPASTIDGNNIHHRGFTVIRGLRLQATVVSQAGETTLILEWMALCRNHSWPDIVEERWSTNMLPSEHLTMSTCSSFDMRSFACPVSSRSQIQLSNLGWPPVKHTIGIFTYWHILCDQTGTRNDSQHINQPICQTTSPADHHSWTATGQPHIPSKGKSWWILVRLFIHVYPRLQSSTHLRNHWFSTICQ